MASTVPIQTASSIGPVTAKGGGQTEALAAEASTIDVGARTKATLAVKRARGERTGGSASYGFQLAADGVHLEPHHEEQKALARILELRQEGMGVAGS
jgi:DNA invertase Pin-like site-specific DNA recombinase